MTSSVIAANSILTFRGGWPWRIAVIAALTALADWLLFRQAVGVSLPLFVLAVGAGVVLANRLETGNRELLLHTGILVAALLPVVEDFNLMSVLIAVLGIGTFALGVSGALGGDLKQKFVAVGWHLISGPFQIVRDLQIFNGWARERGATTSLAFVKGWIVPVGFGAIFIALFTMANPLIDNWLAQWNIVDALKRLDMQRLMFWLGAIVCVWTFVCVCSRFALPDLGAPASDVPAFTYSNLIFNETAVMRSLVLFNLLFAVQTVMDVHYLWRGAALPDGMSYASYAHRGAYPLIVTALLAAAFVIVAMRPGSSAERSPVMRALVFLWVGQNVLLVVSSILRLELYVAIYLLTYWRVAAFIWMLLVATGLVLIVVRIVTYRSNAWLISANAAVLALTIYGCSFANFAHLVASYNVSHSPASVTAGHPIDLTYLTSLGPHAIPALDRYLAKHGEPRFFLSRRDQLAGTHRCAFANWRAWTFRGWRLTRYLESATRAPTLTPP